MEGGRRLDAPEAVSTRQIDEGMERERDWESEPDRKKTNRRKGERGQRGGFDIPVSLGQVASPLSSSIRPGRAGVPTSWYAKGAAGSSHGDDRRSSHAFVDGAIVFSGSSVAEHDVAAAKAAANSHRVWKALIFVLMCRRSFVVFVVFMCVYVYLFVRILVGV